MTAQEITRCLVYAVLEINLYSAKDIETNLSTEITIRKYIKTMV